MSFIDQTELRRRLSRTLSDLYGSEVPAYTTLLDVSQEVNLDYQRQHPASAEALGSIARVTEERHGAIRVGSPRELSQVARVFGAAGMYPVNYYDLRDAHPNPIPVVSTAFRPIDRTELARNPFRVFTSMLVPEDRRFFSEDVESRLKDFISRRELFPQRLLDLASQAIDGGGLPQPLAEEYLQLTASAFALSDEPVNRTWYGELESISSVAADIGGISSTHINHLTPRVLDIDELYRQMGQRGIQMIDSIQGPPKWKGTDVLLRQTSFKALSEPRRFLEPDGSIQAGELRVRFGEVEARGVALTPSGLNHYDALMKETDRQAAQSTSPRSQIAADLWNENYPIDELELIEKDYAFFSFHIIETNTDLSSGTSKDLLALIADGLIGYAPIVYEDFLPRSAAGIFASNLTKEGAVDAAAGGAVRDADWMAQQIGTTIHDSNTIYAAERMASLNEVSLRLGYPLGSINVPWGS